MAKVIELRNNPAGGIDLQILGLGSNGHIGFNEPTGSLNSRTWIKILSENTIRDNSAMFERIEDVPHYCITMGIGTIMDAGHCLVLAFGAKKARAVHAMVEGAMTAIRSSKTPAAMAACPPRECPVAMIFSLSTTPNSSSTSMTGWYAQPQAAIVWKAYSG